MANCGPPYARGTGCCKCCIPPSCQSINVPLVVCPITGSSSATCCSPLFGSPQPQRILVSLSNGPLARGYILNRINNNFYESALKTIYCGNKIYEVFLQAFCSDSNSNPILIVNATDINEGETCVSQTELVGNCCPSTLGMVGTLNCSIPIEPNPVICTCTCCPTGAPTRWKITIGPITDPNPCCQEYSSTTKILDYFSGCTWTDFFSCGGSDTLTCDGTNWTAGLFFGIYTKTAATWNCNGINIMNLDSAVCVGAPATITVEPDGIVTGICSSSSSSSSSPGTICGTGPIYTGNTAYVTGNYTLPFEGQYFIFRPTVTGSYCMGYHVPGGTIASDAAIYLPGCAGILGQTSDYTNTPITVNLTAGLDYPIGVTGPFTGGFPYTLIIACGPCTNFGLCSLSNILTIGTIYCGLSTANYQAFYRFNNPGGITRFARITPTNGSNVFAQSFTDCSFTTNIATNSGTAQFLISLGNVATTNGIIVYANGDFGVSYTIEII